MYVVFLRLWAVRVHAGRISRRKEEEDGIQMGRISEVGGGAEANNTVNCVILSIDIEK